MNIKTERIEQLIQLSNRNLLLIFAGQAEGVTPLETRKLQKVDTVIFGHDKFAYEMVHFVQSAIEKLNPSDKSTFGLWELNFLKGLESLLVECAVVNDEIERDCFISRVYCWFTEKLAERREVPRMTRIGLDDLKQSIVRLNLNPQTIPEHMLRALDTLGPGGGTVTGEGILGEQMKTRLLEDSPLEIARQQQQQIFMQEQIHAFQDSQAMHALALSPTTHTGTGGGMFPPIGGGGTSIAQQATQRYQQYGIRRPHSASAAATGSNSNNNRPSSHQLPLYIKHAYPEILKLPRIGSKQDFSSSLGTGPAAEGLSPVALHNQQNYGLLYNQPETEAEKAMNDLWLARRQQEAFSIKTQQQLSIVMDRLALHKARLESDALRRQESETMLKTMAKIQSNKALLLQQQQEQQELDGDGGGDLDTSDHNEGYGSFTADEVAAATPSGRHGSVPTTSAAAAAAAMAASATGATPSHRRASAITPAASAPPKLKGMGDRLREQGSLLATTGAFPNKHKDNNNSHSPPSSPEPGAMEGRRGGGGRQGRAPAMVTIQTNHGQETSSIPLPARTAVSRAGSITSASTGTKPHHIPMRYKIDVSEEYLMKQKYYLQMGGGGGGQQQSSKDGGGEGGGDGDSDNEENQYDNLRNNRTNKGRLTSHSVSGGGGGGGGGATPSGGGGTPSNRKKSTVGMPPSSSGGGGGAGGKAGEIFFQHERPAIRERPQSARLFRQVSANDSEFRVHYRHTNFRRMPMTHAQEVWLEERERERVKKSHAVAHNLAVAVSSKGGGKDGKKGGSDKDKDAAKKKKEAADKKKAGGKNKKGGAASSGSEGEGGSSPSSPPVKSKYKSANHFMNLHFPKFEDDEDIETMAPMRAVQLAEVGDILDTMDKYHLTIKESALRKALIIPMDKPEAICLEGLREEKEGLMVNPLPKDYWRQFKMSTGGKKGGKKKKKKA